MRKAAQRVARLLLLLATALHSLSRRLGTVNAFLTTAATFLRTAIALLTAAAAAATAAAVTTGQVAWQGDDLIVSWRCNHAADVEVVAHKLRAAPPVCVEEEKGWDRIASEVGCRRQLGGHGCRR